MQPVFDVIVERAVRLCGARMGRVYRYDGELIHMVGGHGLSVPGRSEAERPFPRPASDDTIVGRVMLSRAANILADLDEDETVPPLSRQMISAIGARSQVTMPMLLAGEPIGAITLSWAEPRGYTDQHHRAAADLCRPGGDRDREARLFNETSEALERQTATADILKVIAASPVRRAAGVRRHRRAAPSGCRRRLACGGCIAMIGELIHLVGVHGLAMPGRDEAERPFPRPASADTIVGRVMLSRRARHPRRSRRGRDRSAAVAT